MANPRVSSGPDKDIKVAAALRTYDGELASVQAIEGFNGLLATETKQDAILAALATVTAVVTGSVAVTSLPAADDEGTWGYLAGTAGTVIVGAGVRVIGISATADAAGTTMTINGGQTCSIPINTAIAIMPKGQLVAPTIVFTGTNSYFVETVSG